MPQCVTIFALSYVSGNYLTVPLSSKLNILYNIISQFSYMNNIHTVLRAGFVITAIGNSYQLILFITYKFVLAFAGVGFGITLSISCAEQVAR